MANDVRGCRGRSRCRNEVELRDEPTSDIWVTETSLNSRLDGGGSDCTAQTKGADTFRLIYAHNLVAHLFTYSWGAGGDYLGNNPAQVPCCYQDLYSNGF